MEKISEKAEKFRFEGNLVSAEPYGDGHINDTYALLYTTGDTKRRYILQRMNKSVFPDIGTLMENVALVTDFLAREIEKRGGDCERETLKLIKTKDGKNYFVKIKYAHDDESEMVIRILSFGPMAEVTGSESFKKLIIEKLKEQLNCGLK